MHDNPADTVAACQRVIRWLALIEEPFQGGDLEIARGDALLTVSDALEHVSRQIGATVNEEEGTVHVPF